MKTLSHLLLTALLLSGILACSGNAGKTRQPDTPSAPPVEEAGKFRTLSKLRIAGDFDGDGKQDSVFQHVRSDITGAEIVQAPDPYQVEWDSVISWFHAQGATLYLAAREGIADTLFLGPAQGLYCLLNVGDLNADGRDEIALMVDHLDFSRMNSCLIYSLCKGKWTELKSFEIHESAFDFDGDSMPVFHEIENFLEPEGGEWRYRDYLEEGGANPFEAEEGEWHRLNVMACS